LFTLIFSFNKKLDEIIILHFFVINKPKQNFRKWTSGVKVKTNSKEVFKRTRKTKTAQGIMQNTHRKPLGFRVF